MAPAFAGSFAAGTTSLKDEGAYRVLAAAAALERQGKKVVHLEIGQPGFPTPPFVSDAGIEAIRGGFTTYVNPSGTLDIKEAIAAHVSRTRGVSYTAENIVVGPGAKPGLWFGAQAVVERGDEIVLPDPGFPSYENMAKVLGATSVRYDALVENMGEAIEKVLTPKSKLLILNSPSNPTGRVLTPAQLAAIAAVVAKHPQLWVVSDEIYCHLTYNDDKDQQQAFPTTPSLVSFPGMLERTLIVDGFSKTFSMTGWRLGFVACPKALAEKLHLLMTHAVGCTASFTQKAGAAALAEPDRAAKSVGEMVKEYKLRRDYVVSRLNRLRGVRCEAPQGAFYAFADVSGLPGVSAREFSDKCLHEGLVAILPGGDFGVNGENFIRISYVGTMEVLKEGLDRIEKVVDSMYDAKEESPSKRVKRA